MAFDLMNMFGSNLGTSSLGASGSMPNFSLGATPQISPAIDMSKVSAEPTIFGMAIPNFTSTLGQIGTAIGGDTGGGKISQVAQAIGSTQLKAIMAQNQQKSSNKFLTDFISGGGDINKITPEQLSAMGFSLGDYSKKLGTGPSGSTGLETGAISPAKLGTLNTASSF